MVEDLDELSTVAMCPVTASCTHTAGTKNRGSWWGDLFDTSQVQSITVTRERDSDAGHACQTFDDPSIACRGSETTK